tara:strand:- start:1052 stop:1588 length:537 start_codon:yes stop_codon:yes gene_type:complete
MSILSGPEIEQLLKAGSLMKGWEFSHINASSLDVRLGDDFLCELAVDANVNLVTLEKGCETPYMHKVSGDLKLAPGEFCLAHTKEEFNLPDNVSAEFRLKSSVARKGLDHALAVWIDAGFHGSVLTLELRNNLRNHSIVLKAGDKIGQIVFHRHENAGEYSYKKQGSYNNSKSVTRAN